MVEIRYLLLIILLGICIYLIYNLYSYQSKNIDKLKEYITETIEIECEQINDKIDNIEQIIDKKINECNKKIKDLCSLQNKINEVNKMNGQSIINQYNQFDDGFEDNIDNDEIKNQIFNSTDNQPINNCFIKINQIKGVNDDKDMFYMSPVNNQSFDKQNNKNSNNNTDTSKLSSKSTKSTKSSKQSSKQFSKQSNKQFNSTTSKDSKKSDSKKSDSNSTVLEISGDFFKSNYINNNQPVSNIFNILNKSSSFIKNNLHKVDNTSNNSTLSNVKDYIINNKENIEDKNINNENDSNNSSNNSSNNEILFTNDPPLIPNIFINKFNNKVVEIN